MFLHTINFAKLQSKLEGRQGINGFVNGFEVYLKTCNQDNTSWFPQDCIRLVFHFYQKVFEDWLCNLLWSAKHFVYRTPVQQGEHYQKGSDSHWDIHAENECIHSQKGLVKSFLLVLHKNHKFASRDFTICAAPVLRSSNRMREKKIPKHNSYVTSWNVSSANHSAKQCRTPCAMRGTCSECTSSSSECMWCSNMKQCVDSNAYVASFPFGQCMEWYTMNTCPRKISFSTLLLFHLQFNL